MGKVSTPIIKYVSLAETLIIYMVSGPVHDFPYIAAPRSKTHGYLERFKL